MAPILEIIPVGMVLCNWAVEHNVAMFQSFPCCMLVEKAKQRLVHVELIYANNLRGYVLSYNHPLIPGIEFLVLDYIMH